MSDVAYWFLAGTAVWLIAGLVVALFLGRISWHDDDDDGPGR